MELTCLIIKVYRSTNSTSQASSHTPARSWAAVFILHSYFAVPDTYFAISAKCKDIFDDQAKTNISLLLWKTHKTATSTQDKIELRMKYSEKDGISR